MSNRVRILLYAILVGFLCLLAACESPGGTSAPAVLSVDVNAAAAAGGPQLVRRSPMQGERLGLAPVIELTFDRDMDPQTTAAAWTFSGPGGAVIPGQITWPDARTLRFSPEARLDPDSKYLGSLSTSAASAAGDALGEDLRLDFRTSSAFVVGQVLPADGTGDIEVDTSITVVFNRPVVPVTIVEEQAALPQPLEFSPQVSGSGEWVNSSMYIFQPDGALQSGTRFEVRVAAGLQDVSGNSLESDFVWIFFTRAVTGFVNNSAYDRILLDDPIGVTFVQPMDPESVAAALSVVDRETGHAVPVSLKWFADNTQLEIKPVGRYRIASFYRLTIGTTALAQTGGSLQDPITLDFSTLPMPQVEQVYPKPDSIQDGFDSTLSIIFSSPMNIESLKGRVKITPEPEGDPRWYYNEYGYQYYCYCLQPGTQYVVRVLPGAADIYGNLIRSEYSFSFTTGDYSPYASLLSPGTPLVYRENDEQGIFFEYSNINSASISLYRISLDQVGSLVSGRVYSSDFLPGLEQIRTWEPDVAGNRNQLVRILLDFKGDDGTPLAPGYYFLGLTASPISYYSRYLQGVLFMVSTDNITLKVSPSEALAWLVDLETGEPTPNVPVVIYDRGFHEIGRAVTDADGLVYLDGLKDPAYAGTDDPGHLAFVSQDWGSGVSTSQYGMWSNYYSDVSPRFVYVYTERPLYRPGQEVFFTGIVRHNDDLHYSLPFAPTVSVTVEHEGEKLYSQELALSADGSFTGTFKLGEDAALGSYDIYVRASPYSSDPFGSVSFRVAEYHKPEFQVLASASPADVLAGDDINVDLSARYYSGSNVGNAQVYWYMEATPYYFYPGGEYGRYSFTDWDRDTYWSNPQLNAPAVLQEGTTSTDADGNLSLDVVASLGHNSTSRQVQFYADVTDLSGNVVGTRASLVVHQSQVYAGIRADNYIGVEGDPQTFNLVALDWASNPVAGQVLSVDVVERRWYSVQEQDAQGQVQWITSVQDVPVTHFAGVVTDAEGRASITFTPQKGGIYKAIVTVRDSHGRAQQASTYLWVAGPEYIPWRQTNDRSFSLVADRDSYSPGDTAEILIAQPFEGPVYALVTVERGHIYSREVVQLDGSSTIYHLPITAEMIPATYVSVVVIDGAESGSGLDFKMGMTRINVDTSLATLNVSVTADHTQAGPGDTVTYTIDVHDADGNPVTAELSVALVDKAALALAAPNSPPILDAFYSVRSLNVATAVGIVASAEDFNANYSEIPPDGEHAGGGGKGVGDEGVIDVREEFRDTAFFQAQITTDLNGRAQVSITLPENLTTWSLDVRAATADSLVGQATHELVSTKAVFIQLQTPRFFVAGDAATIGATVFNNSSGPLQVQVSLEAQGAQPLSNVEQTVEVAGMSQAYVTWDVQVQNGAGRVDLTAHAVSGVYQDASKPPLGTLDGQGLPVYAFHVIETVGTSGLLRGADSITEAIQLPSTIPLDDASVSVELTPSLAASIQESLAYLQDYPYLCMEQSISSFLPNVVSARILRLSGQPAGPLQANLDKQVASALQRIYSHQHSDGGWEWWGYDSDPLTSAYVVLGLVEAQQAGYSVSPDVLANGVEFLKNNLPTLSPEDATWRYNRQAFMIYVLARADALPAAKAVSLYDRRDLLSLYAKAYLAQALYSLNPENSRTATLMAELNSAAILSAAGAHWEETEDDYWNWNNDLRTTAIVLNAYVQIDPGNPVTANAVRWLMAHRSAGHWGTTQNTAWTLMAFSNWLATSQEFDTDYAYAVGLNGDLLQQGVANTDNLSEAVKLKIDLSQMLSDAVNYLVFTRGEGPGNLYYTAYLDAALPVSQIQPLDQGIVVSRQYFSLDDNKTPITQIARGQVVQVRVTLIAPAALHYVIVNDSLPAGLEAIDSTLLTDVNVPSQYTRQRFMDFGWGWWYFDHIERRDEKVVLSADYLPAGTYVYIYQARASTVGTFNVIPVTAEEFYFPDVAGRGAGSVFVVTR